MAYLLLILEPPEQRRTRSDAEGRDAYERMLAYSRDLQTRGVLVASESLTATRDAARVTVRAGERKVVDGPFSEAKELVGGFFLLNCSTRAEAVEIAAACPAAEWCTVEVRATGPCFE